MPVLNFLAKVHTGKFTDCPQALLMIFHQMFVFDSENAWMFFKGESGLSITQPTFGRNPIALRVIRMNRRHYVPTIADQVDELDPVIEISQYLR